MKALQTKMNVMYLKILFVPHGKHITKKQPVNAVYGTTTALRIMWNISTPFALQLLSLRPEVIWSKVWILRGM